MERTERDHHIWWCGGSCSSKIVLTVSLRKLTGLTLSSNGNLHSPPHLRESKKRGNKTFFKDRCRLNSTRIGRIEQGPSSFTSRDRLDLRSSLTLAMVFILIQKKN